MGGAVSGIVNTVGKILDPGGLVQKTVGDPLGIDYTDPLGIGKEPEQAPIIESETGLTDTEKANLAQQEAARKKSKAKSGTKTVLTSPLGATTTASTAVAKLGGA
jgi:hypothetical protein